ncbi:hypothetical protein MSAN_00510500 [Mycena sanguinolenta]|uniref:Uncharacterized protein n=1 Tax=Mycena sanguinolenta TaxID=230812 RepID=A0A8H7DG16_9AGAR|nr:hypothetical protein MSAN_00510500 [Mycena sanguinolenta]
MLNHIVKRGVAHLQAVTPDYMARLQEDAQLYEKAGPIEISPMETVPVLITGIIVFLILASIRYTLGDVVASLAMIESPSTTAIVEQKLPAYADEEPLIPTEADIDVEITIVDRKPITVNLCKTMRHLRSVGGFFARWRGLGVSILYSVAYGLVSSILSGFLGALIFGTTLFGQAVVSILSSLVLVRLHMLWTHTMIAHPTTKSLRQRICPPRPMQTPHPPDLRLHAALRAAQENDCAALVSLALRVLAVPVAAALIALFVLLPASATLTRIEAALLPADMQPIVAFDRAALVGDIDLTLRGSSRTLFVAAWRSFDCAARVRMLKLYAKMLGAQIAVAFVGMQIMAAEIYVIGGERLTILFTSARAQLELMALEAQQNGI